MKVLNLPVWISDPDKDRINMHEPYEKGYWLRHFKVGNLIENCCTHFQVVAEYKIVKDFDPDPEMFADERKIEQVLVNFVKMRLNMRRNQRKLSYG